MTCTYQVLDAQHNVLCKRSGAKRHQGCAASHTAGPDCLPLIASQHALRHDATTSVSGPGAHRISHMLCAPNRWANTGLMQISKCCCSTLTAQSANKGGGGSRPASATQVSSQCRCALQCAPKQTTRQGKLQDTIVPPGSILPPVAHHCIHPSTHTTPTAAACLPCSRQTHQPCTDPTHLPCAMPASCANIHHQSHPPTPKACAQQPQLRTHVAE
jgi:hypothetical protein